MPFVDRKYRVYLGGTSDRTYTLAAERGWGVAVPPLLPYVALEKQLDLYRAVLRGGTAPSPTSSGSTPATSTRIARPRIREAREWITGFITGNSSPLTEWPKPPAEDLTRPATASTPPESWSRSREVPYEKLIEDDYVWVGTPQDIIERIEATRKVCEGIQEIGITVNAGGAPHWMAIKNQELFASAVMPHFNRKAVTAGA